MPEAEQRQYRKLAFAVCLEAYRKVRRPICLDEIFWGVWEWKAGMKVREIVRGVQDRVYDAIDEGVWPFGSFARGKRTVDRRVNEAAAPVFVRATWRC
jgi:hypothetical protein